MGLLSVVVDVSMARMNVIIVRVVAVVVEPMTVAVITANKPNRDNDETTPNQEKELEPMLKASTKLVHQDFRAAHVDEGSSTQGVQNWRGQRSE